jgi:hypothetical protein
MALISRNTLTTGLFIPNLGNAPALTLFGTATSNGTTTTLIDATTLTQIDANVWLSPVAASINFTSGTNNNLQRTVTNFNIATDTLTVATLTAATAIGDTYNINISPRPGPSRIRIYSIAVGGTVASTTTGLIIQIQDQLATPTVLAKQYFQTPVNTSVNMSGVIKYDWPGAFFDVPIGISILGTWTGTGGTVLSTEVVFDYE